MNETNQFKCLSKLLTVCNNRKMSNIGKEILKSIAPRFLEGEELKELAKTIKGKSLKVKNPKSINRLIFLKKTKFAKACSRCQKIVEKDQAAFLKDIDLYHVLCGKEVFGIDADQNSHYQIWRTTITKPLEVINGPEEEANLFD